MSNKKRALKPSKKQLIPITESEVSMEDELLEQSNNFKIKIDWKNQENKFESESNKPL